MRRTTSILLGLCLLSVSMPAMAASAIPQEQWQPQAGDELYVDVNSNTGYLLHPDGDYLPFILATGVRKTIRYIGRTYFAATPLKSWVAKEETVKGDRVTFGDTGRFFRLFDNGTKSTPYGIHSNRDIDKWLTEADRYKSYGCIVVSEEMINVIEAAFKLNGNELKVTTTYGLQKFLDEVALRETKTF